MGIDEQMVAIERTYYDGLNLPWASEVDHGTFEVRDAHRFAIVDDGSEPDNAYLVACANAAPDLCADIHRLRNELADAKETIIILQHNINDDQDRLVHVRTLLARQEPVVAAARGLQAVNHGSAAMALAVEDVRRAVREFEKGGAG